MTSFQLLCALLFLGVLVLAYGKTLAQKLRALVQRGESAVTAQAVDTSIAVPLVEDIVAVTKLRDKLAAEGCKDGVAACTALLRVIVEYEQPSKNIA